MSDVASYPLRLPRSLKAGVERMSKRDGTSINQFVAMAAAKSWPRWTQKTTFAAVLHELTWLRLTASCPVQAVSRRLKGMSARSLGGRRNVGCKLTAAVYFSPMSCQISRYSAVKSSKTIPSLRPIFAQTPSAAQAPS